MAAVAEQEIQEFNIESDHYSYAEFVEKCKHSKVLHERNSHYCICITTDQGIRYYCSILPSRDKFQMYFLNTDTCFNMKKTYPTDPLEDNNESTFLFIRVHNWDYPADSSLTTNVPFNRLHYKDKLLSPLETIIYIRSCFYRMISVLRYRITDGANGNCNDSVANKYLLLVYRLFKKRSVSIDATYIEDLSIYYRYFKHKYKDNIKRVDNMDIINYKEPALLEQVNKVRELTFNFGHGEVPIVDYFAEFTRESAMCGQFAKDLISMHDSLMETNHLYQNVYRELTTFIVKTEDCIFYTSVQKGGSTRRSMTRSMTRSSSRYQSYNRSKRLTTKSPKRSINQSANQP